MKGILADHNIEKHLYALAVILQSDTWRELWDHISISLHTFRDLSFAEETSDLLLWQKCQQEQLILITANRNADGPDSLELTIQTLNESNSLPVLTLADPDRVLQSKTYAERIVERLLEILIDIDNYRGTGRVFLP